jgi:membrane protein YqaA with SNARE-associated domain
LFEPATFATWGLPGLFLAALLAGSVVPMPSEAVLAFVLHAGVPPSSAVAVATLGNVLGAGSLYLLGAWAPRGGWAARRLRLQQPRLLRAQQRLRRWGPALLLLSWLPLLGDAFVLAAGFAGVRALPFLVFTALGKGMRYTLVAVSVMTAL